MNNIIEKPIGIFGGTFDPVHNGHLRIGDHILQTFHLEKILWIPCNQPAHRKTPIASPQSRLEMLKRATKNNPAFEVSDIEIKRGGVSYMIDTLSALRSSLPNTPLCLILGADAFSKINLWHQWESLLNYTHFIVVNRNNYETPNSEWLKTLCENHQTTQISCLSEKIAGRIYFETINPIPISATAIRNALSSGEKPKMTLPEAVYNYIISNSLYQ